MKIISGNTDKVTIEFSQEDFDNIQMYFLSKKEEYVYNSSQSLDQFNSIRKLIQLEDIISKDTSK